LAVGVGVLVGVGVGVNVNVGVGVTVGVGVGVGVGVLVGVAVMVGVGVRRSGRVISWVVERGPDGVCTTACTVTIRPWFAASYLIHDNASPGCASTGKPNVHGGAWPVNPGLVTETPPSGERRLNCTG